MSDATLAQIIPGAFALGGAAVAFLGNYLLQYRGNHISDKTARVLCDTRLLEAILLLLPAMSSGEFSANNVAVLEKRIATLDDPQVHTAYRNNPGKLASMGQLQICSLRLIVMFNSGESDQQAVRSNANSGIANAIVAFSNKNVRSFAIALAARAGYVHDDDANTRAIATLTYEGARSEETWDFVPRKPKRQ